MWWSDAELSGRSIEVATPEKIEKITENVGGQSEIESVRLRMNTLVWHIYAAFAHNWQQRQLFDKFEGVIGVVQL